MSPLSCQDVVERIELFAAGECDEPERSALRQHLSHCSACARLEQEARELVGLLDLHLREPERLGRLQARLRVEGRPSARPAKILPFTRRLSALAAMLLVAVGLSLWIHSQGQFTSQNPLVLAWGPAESARNVEPALFHQPAVAAVKAEENIRVYALDLHGKTAAQFRQEIQTAKDRLPDPPLVNLSLELRNATDKALQVYVGAEGSELILDLSGPGVVSAAAGFAADFLVSKTIQLEPGRSYRLPITRLVFGSRDKVQAAYWTEPGEFTLAFRYKVALSPAPRGAPRAVLPGGEKIGFVTLRSAPMKIQVK